MSIRKPEYIFIFYIYYLCVYDDHAPRATRPVVMVRDDASRARDVFRAAVGFGFGSARKTRNASLLFVILYETVRRGAVVVVNTIFYFFIST